MDSAYRIHIISHVYVKVLIKAEKAVHLLGRQGSNLGRTGGKGYGRK